MPVNIGKIRQQPSDMSHCYFDCHFANPDFGRVIALKSRTISCSMFLLPQESEVAWLIFVISRRISYFMLIQLDKVF